MKPITLALVPPASIRSGMARCRRAMARRGATTGRRSIRCARHELPSDCLLMHGVPSAPVNATAVEIKTEFHGATGKSTSDK
jgi:hypothetical protein